MKYRHWDFALSYMSDSYKETEIPKSQPFPVHRY